MSIITLLTDFGPDDTYVAAMKGVILGINPGVTLVDLCHTVPPQDVREGAYLLGSAYRDFPPGTVHLAVVDPGVGSARRAIAFQAGGHTFVGPDNGLFSYVLADCGAKAPRDESRGMFSASGAAGFNPQGRLARSSKERSLSLSKGAGAPEPFALPRGARAVELTVERYWRRPVSQTFHGRDIFAPVAAHLSLNGVPSTSSGNVRRLALGRLGRPLRELMAFPLPAPERLPDGSVRGEVIHVDRFGNLVTNLRPEDLPPGGEPTFTLTLRPLPKGEGSPTPLPLGEGWVRGTTVIRGLSASYAEAAPMSSMKGLLAIVGSSGRIEIALRDGSAAGRLGVGRGAVVEVFSSLVDSPPVGP